MEAKAKKLNKKPVDLSGEDKEPTFFDVPKKIQEELSAKGLDCRWINSKKYQADYGMHRSGWKAYKTTPNQRIAGSLDFGDGVDAEGFIRRGDLLLAVKTKEMSASHRERIKRKTDALNNYTKQTAKELRERYKGVGKVFEGYEVNDGEKVDDEE